MVLSVLLATAVTSCSGDDSASPEPSRQASRKQTPEQSAQAASDAPSNDDLRRVLPTTAELPAGWKRTDSKSVGWRDAATSEEFAKYLPCAATAQESAERHGYGSIVFDAPGNGGNGGDGIDLTLSVPRSPGTLDGPAPKAEAVSLVEENLTLYRKLYDCYNPKNAGIGDSSIVFTTERFTHIIMRVGPVEVAYSPTKSVSENSSPSS
ncbi:hypothetical protein ACVWZD_006205 [Streptomyces sp. TE3672]